MHTERLFWGLPGSTYVPARVSCARQSLNAFPCHNEGMHSFQFVTRVKHALRSFVGQPSRSGQSLIERRRSALDLLHESAIATQLLVFCDAVTQNDKTHSSCNARRRTMHDTVGSCAVAVTTTVDLAKLAAELVPLILCFFLTSDNS
jgi:hypothetical protein